MSEVLDITAADVAEYLKQHPDFFASHENLLGDLRIPHESGQAISLVERQLGVLRERNVELRERLHSLLDVARDNDQLFEKTRALILALLDAPDLVALAHTLVRELRVSFNSELITFMIFDCEETFPSAVAMPLATAKERVPSLLRGRAVAGQLRRDELAFLFSDSAQQVASCAVVPIALEKPQGLLAIGSSNPDHFKSSMDTMFITHIGDVLARLMASFANERN